MEGITNFESQNIDWDSLMITVFGGVLDNNVCPESGFNAEDRRRGCRNLTIKIIK